MLLKLVVLVPPEAYHGIGTCCLIFLAGFLGGLLFASVVTWDPETMCPKIIIRVQRASRTTVSLIISSTSTSFARYVHWNDWWFQVQSLVWQQLKFMIKNCLWGWWFGKIDRQFILLNIWIYSCRWWCQWPNFPKQWLYLALFLLMLTCPWLQIREFPRLLRTLVSQSWHIIRVLPLMFDQNEVLMWFMFCLVRPCIATPYIWDDRSPP